MEGKKYGKYEIVEKIGQGGMGEVYKARDPVLKRDVAVKTITANVSGDDDLRTRFEREAQLAAGLNHPNIVHIYDFGEEGGKIYMAMELLLGRDLKAAIKKNGLPKMDDKLALMEDVCEGLAFAHFREIVHRDLKPANIHIQPDGRAKIMDFGLAKLESSDMTRTGVIMGTPDYMSPEQVQGGKADARSDVYSMGAVFYELLTGRRPFQAESTHALLFQVLYNQPDPVTKHVPEIPLAVQGIVDRAMSKDPAMRFQNGGEMRDAVRLARQGLLGDDNDATLVADISLPPGIPGAGPTPYPGSGPQGGGPFTPPSVPPGTPMPISGGPSGYPQPMTPGSGTVGSMTPGSMTPGSAGFAGFTQPTVVVQKSNTGLYIGLGVAAVAIIAAILYATNLLPGLKREDPAVAQQEVADMKHQMLQRDLDAAQEAFTQKSFDRALSQVERVLNVEPENAEALSLKKSIEEVRANLQSMATQAEEAIATGDTATAAATVSRMLEMEPNYGPALSLSGQLDEQFRGEADEARSAMQKSRRRAEQTQGAASLGSFVTAASVAGEAQALYEQGRFGQATARFKAAALGFDSSRTEAVRVARQKPAEPEAPPPDPSEAQSARRAMESARTRAQGTEGAASLGSFVTAGSMVREAERLYQQRKYPEAMARFQSATDGYDAARSEAVRIASQKKVIPPPDPQPPAPVPQPQPATPKPPADEKPAIRELVQSYERVFENRDLDLYRSIKPNLSPNEEKALGRLFDRVKVYEVAVEIKSIDVRGSAATVDIFRQDTMDGKPSRRISQKLFLSRTEGGRWIIESLGQ